MSDLQKDIDQIIGYGKKIKVLIGKDKDGNDNIEEFHITPISLDKIPEFMKRLEAVMNASNFNTDEAIVKLSELIKMSMTKMHPNISAEEIANKLGLGGMAEVVNIIVDINDFFSKMEKLKVTMMGTKKNP